MAAERLLSGWRNGPVLASAGRQRTPRRDWRWWTHSDRTADSAARCWHSLNPPACCLTARPEGLCRPSCPGTTPARHRAPHRRHPVAIRNGHVSRLRHDFVPHPPLLRAAPGRPALAMPGGRLCGRRAPGRAGCGPGDRPLAQARATSVMPSAPWSTVSMRWSGVPPSRSARSAPSRRWPRRRRTASSRPRPPGAAKPLMPGGRRAAKEPRGCMRPASPSRAWPPSLARSARRSGAGSRPVVPRSGASRHVWVSSSPVSATSSTAGRRAAATPRCPGVNSSASATPTVMEPCGAGQASGARPARRSPLATPA